MCVCGRVCFACLRVHRRVHLRPPLRLPSLVLNSPTLVRRTQIIAQECFSHFFKEGAAAERLVTNDSLFNAVVATSTPHGNSSVGGNAAIMALAMSRAAGGSGSVHLGGPVGPRLAALLGAGVKVVDPGVTHDEVSEQSE